MWQQTGAREDDFIAVQWDLTINEERDTKDKKCSDQEKDVALAWYRTKDVSGKAKKWLTKSESQSWKFQALGKVGYDKSFGEIMQMLDTQGMLVAKAQMSFLPCLKHLKLTKISQGILQTE